MISVVNNCFKLVTVHQERDQESLTPHDRENEEVHQRSSSRLTINLVSQQNTTTVSVPPSTTLNELQR